MACVEAASNAGMGDVGNPVRSGLSECGRAAGKRRVRGAGWGGVLVSEIACGLAETTSRFFRQSYGWPLAPLGTCEVIRFRTNSRIRFLAAPSPMPAKPLKTTSEAPRSEEG